MKKLLVALIVVLAFPVSASAMTLGEGRKAINIYGTELAGAYAEISGGTALPWYIEKCSPHGSDNRRVHTLVCAIEIEESACRQIVAAVDRHVTLEGWKYAGHHRRAYVYVQRVKCTETHSPDPSS